MNRFSTVLLALVALASIPGRAECQDYWTSPDWFEDAHGGEYVWVDYSNGYVHVPIEVVDTEVPDAAEARYSTAVVTIWRNGVRVTDSTIQVNPTRQPNQPGTPATFVWDATYVTGGFYAQQGDILHIKVKCKYEVWNVGTQSFLQISETIENDGAIVYYP